MAGKRSYMQRYKSAKKKGRVAKKPVPASFAAKVKKVILRNAEPKMLPYAHNILAPQQLLHNSYAAPYILTGSFQMPTQGVTDIQRVGDEIMVSHVGVQMLFGQKQDRMNVSFRVIVVKCTANASPISYATLMINTTGNVLLDNVNRDRCSVVSDQIIKRNISPQLDVVGGAKELTFVKKWNIPYKQKIKFAVDADTVDNNRKALFMYVFAYDAFGTLVTDNIAYCQLHSTIYYKDP